MSIEHEYRMLLSEILDRFTENGHPGARCVRSQWVDLPDFETWKARLQDLHDRIDGAAEDTAENQASPVTAGFPGLVEDPNQEVVLRVLDGRCLRVQVFEGEGRGLHLTAQLAEVGEPWGPPLRTLVEHETYRTPSGSALQQLRDTPLVLPAGAVNDAIGEFNRLIAEADALLISANPPADYAQRRGLREVWVILRSELERAAAAPEIADRRADNLAAILANVLSRFGGPGTLTAEDDGARRSSWVSRSDLRSWRLQYNRLVP